MGGKSSLGIAPRHLWVEKRLCELHAYIKRCVDMDYTEPADTNREILELEKELERINNENSSC